MEKLCWNHGFSECWLSQDKWLKWSGWWGNFSGCVNHKREEILLLECRCQGKTFVSETNVLCSCLWINTSQCPWQDHETSLGVGCRMEVQNPSEGRILLNPCEGWWFMPVFCGGWWPKAVVEDHAGAASHTDWNFLVLPYFQQFCWELLSLDTYGKISPVFRIIKVEKWPLRPLRP